MEPLSLSNALKLYDILQEHLPEFNKDEEPIEFIGKIIKNIRSSEKHRDYLDAVSIMTGISVIDLTRHSSEEVLEMFVNGLSTNKIISLKEFAQQVGYNARSR
jgi:hypothetical protein